VTLGAVKLLAGLAAVAGVLGALAISRGGTGGADRGAFFADVARRLDLTIPRPPRPSIGARPLPAPAPQDTWRWGGRGVSIDAAAGYLGMTPGQVREELRTGLSLADVARLHGGDSAGLQRSIEVEVARRLSGLSDEERRQLVDRLEEIMHRDGRPYGWAGRGGP
jgi:hypothetical protein